MTSPLNPALSYLKYIEDRFQGYDAEKMRPYFDEIRTALTDNQRLLEALQGVRDLLTMSLENFGKGFSDDLLEAWEMNKQALARLDAVLSEGE